MPNNTPNLNLIKPLPTEAYDISIPNANMDILDTAVQGTINGLEYYFAQNGDGVFTGVNNISGYIHNVYNVGQNMRIVIKNTSANTGNVTIMVSGMGPYPVVRKDGSQIPPGGLKANTVYMLYYDGTSFLLLGDGGEYGTAAAPQVLHGYTIGTDAGLVSGSIPTKNAQTFTPGTMNQTISSGQYLGGAQTILGDPDLIAGNVRFGKNIFGVEGTFSRVLSGYEATSNDIRTNKTAYVNGEVVNGTLSTVAGGNTIVPGQFAQTAVSGGTIVDNTISVSGSPNLIASNIKDGTQIFGVTGNLKVPKKGNLNSLGAVVEYTTYAPNSTTQTTIQYPQLVITGLGFKPSRVIIRSSQYKTSTLRTSRYYAVYDSVNVVNPTQFDDVNLFSIGNDPRFVVIPTSNVTETEVRLPVDIGLSSFSWEAYP